VRVPRNDNVPPPPAVGRLPVRRHRDHQRQRGR
jgi:hypothetical protein